MDIELNVNGQKSGYNIIKDYTEPCSICGARDCSGEYYIIKEDKEAIRLDRSDLNMLLSDYLSEYIFNNEQNRSKYTNLPLFIREYNEAKGWNWNSDTEYLIYAQDFINTIQLVKVGCKGKFEDMCNSLIAFAEESVKNKENLFILDY